MFGLKFVYVWRRTGLHCTRKEAFFILLVDEKDNYLNKKIVFEEQPAWNNGEVPASGAGGASDFADPCRKSFTRESLFPQNILNLVIRESLFRG